MQQHSRCSHHNLCPHHQPPPTDLARAKRIRSGVFFALLTALSFGGLTTLANLYYRDGGNVLTMLLFRFGFATLGLFACAYGNLRPPPPRRFVGVIAVGIAWSFGVAAYLASVHYIAVGIAALILYTFPVGVLILSLIARELRSTTALWAVFLIAFGGLAVMLVPSVGRMNSLGLWFAFAASLLFAVTFFLGAQVTRKVAPRNMTFWVTAVGFVIIVPAVYFSDALALPQTVVGWSALGAATALYFGGILAQFTALSRAPAAQASVVMNLEPVVSVALGAWILGERLSPVQWLGAVAVIGAMLWSQKVMQRSAR